ncbi:MAG: cellulase N-terminal Ig-like domain-containing protein [Armatimonadota bacterium]
MRRLTGLASGLVLCILSSCSAAVDVLVNQVGFEPNSPKIFRVQQTTDFQGDLLFRVCRVSDGREVFNGPLIRKGSLWDRFYWEGDFSSLKTPGDYYISVTVDGESVESYPFSIRDNIWLN